MFSHGSLDDIHYSKQIQHSIRNRKLKRRSKDKNKILNKFHSHSKRRSSSTSTSREDNKCAVCLDDSCILDTKLFPCKHSFHGQCLIQWVKSTNGKKFNCPLCRQDISFFIQKTQNTEINNQLTQLWNERFLADPAEHRDDKYDKYDDHDKLKLDDDLIKPSKKELKIEIDDDKLKTLPNHQKSVHEELTSNTNLLNLDKDDDIDNNKNKLNNILNDDKVEYKPIWNMINNTLLSSKSYKLLMNIKQIYDQSMLFNSTLCNMVYDISNQTEIEQDTDIHFNVLTNNDKLYDIPILSQNDINMLFKSNEEVNTHHDNIQSQQSKIEIIDNSSDDLLSFSSLNIKSGILAGLFAGSSTYLISSHLLYRNSLRLLPILYETVPSVAIFFTSYEHLKKYLFNVDNINNTYLTTFNQRFISAGLASSFAYIVPLTINKNIGCGLLPLRFATFFGTFELCKDLIDKRSEKLNLFQVASAAGIGGTVAHSLYYPLAQYKNINKLSSQSILPLINSAADSGLSISTYSASSMSKTLYKGWIQSFTKFIPSCIVCSCAFEYSRRYLK